MSAGGTKRPVAGLVALAVLAIGAGVSVPVLRAERATMVRETADIRRDASASAQVRDSLQAVTATLQATLDLEAARATAREEPKLHLVIAVDSGTVALMRDGIVLRSMPAHFSGTAPARGTQSIASITEAAPAAATPVVDSLGNPVVAAPAEKTVQRVALTDGTVLEGGDAAAALLGGTDRTGGPRRIIVSRRDFAAIQPNLVKGMKAVLF